MSGVGNDQLKYQISGDAKGLIDALKQAQKALESANKETEKGAKSAKVASAGAEEYIKTVNRIPMSMKEAAKSSQESFKQIGSGIAVTIGFFEKLAKAAGLIGLADIFREGVKAGWEFNATVEQSYIALSNMIGSEKEASAMLDELINMSARTPLLFSNIAKGTQQLLAYQFEAKKIPELIKAIGDANAGLGHGQLEFDRIILALGQIQAKSKVMAQEMRQLAEQGIPSWQILAEGFGVTTKEMMRQVEYGFVDGKKAIDLLVKGMEERFPDMMQKQALSWRGLMTTLKDFGNMTVGTVLMPAFKSIEDQVAHLALQVLPNFAQTVRETGVVAATYMYFPDFAPIVDTISQSITSLINLIKLMAPSLKTFFTTWRNTIAGVLDVLLQLFNSLLSVISGILKVMPDGLEKVLVGALAVGVAFRSMGKYMIAFGQVGMLLGTRVLAAMRRGMLQLSLALKATTVQWKINRAAVLGNVATQQQLWTVQRGTIARNSLIRNSFGTLNPVILGVVAGLAAFGGALYLLKRHHENLKESVKGTWELAKTAAEAAGYEWKTIASYSSGATLKVKEFTEANRVFLDQLHEMDSVEGRRARVYQMLVSMQLRGVQEGDLREFVDQVRNQVNIGEFDFSYTFTGMVQSLERYSKAIETDLTRIVDQYDDAYSRFRGISVAWSEQIESLALTAKDFAISGNMDKALESWIVALDVANRSYSGVNQVQAVADIMDEFKEALDLDGVTLDVWNSSLRTSDEMLQELAGSLYKIDNTALRGEIWEALVRLPQFWESGGFYGDKQTASQAKVTAANWNNLIAARERYERSLDSGASAEEALENVVYDQAASLSTLKKAFQDIYDPANAFNDIIEQQQKLAEEQGKDFVFKGPETISQWTTDLEADAKEWEGVMDTVERLVAEGVNPDALMGIVEGAGEYTPEVLAQLENDPAQREKLIQAFTLKYSTDFEAVLGVLREEHTKYLAEQEAIMNEGKTPLQILKEKLANSYKNSGYEEGMVDNWLVNNDYIPESLDGIELGFRPELDVPEDFGTDLGVVMGTNGMTSFNSLDIPGQVSAKFAEGAGLGASSLIQKIHSRLATETFTIKLAYTGSPPTSQGGGGRNPDGSLIEADVGGWLMPGINRIVNNTGKPEQIVGPQTAATVEALTKQVSMLVAGASNVGGGGTTINVVDSASLRKTQDAKRRMSRV